jgi:predicted permease
MPSYLVLPAVAVVAWRFRHGVSARFPLLARSQLAVSALLALLAGWALPRVGIALVAVFAALVVAEVVAFALAARRLPPEQVPSVFSNTGFWAYPVVTALVGPHALPLAVVYDILSSWRAGPIAWVLRRTAPTPQTRRTALVDYLPTAAFGAGLVLKLVAAPPDVPWQQPTAAALGLYGFALLGLSLPDRLPSRRQLLAGSRILLYRMGLPVAALGLLVVAGVDVPAVGWVLATAPSLFSPLTFARMYGYDPRSAAVGVVVTVPTAVVLLAGLAALG